MTARAFRFRDINIRTKIAVTLGTLVLTMCVTGWFSADRIMRVHETTVDINTSWLPSIRYIGEIRYNMARHRAIISRHVMTSEPDQKAKIEERVRLARDNVEKVREIYQPLITSVAERAAYDAFVPAWQAYLAASAKMLAVRPNSERLNCARRRSLTWQRQSNGQLPPRSRRSRLKLSKSIKLRRRCRNLHLP
jgi:hypothetical protein